MTMEAKSIEDGYLLVREGAADAGDLTTYLTLVFRSISANGGFSDPDVDISSLFSIALDIAKKVEARLDKAEPLLGRAMDQIRAAKNPR